MSLSDVAFKVPNANCCVEPFPDEFGGSGLACSRSTGKHECLLAVPLACCLVVADHAAPSLEHRGNHPLCIRQVLVSLQNQWRVSLPQPLRDYIQSSLLGTELRLAAMLAWMTLHAPAMDGYWAQWFSCLPSMQDVPMLSTVSELELQVLESYAPHLADRARRAKEGREQAWVEVVAAAPHIWLALPNLTPDTIAPISFPLGDPEGSTQCAAPCGGSTCTRRVGRMQQLFHWACMIVSSRSFCLVDNTGKKYACLAPLADFANHDPFSSNTAFQLGMVPSPCTFASSRTACAPSLGLLLTARVTLARGDEVTINYGADKSNALLLEAYGFALPANLADRLPWGWRGRPRDYADLHQLAADLNKLGPTCAATLASLGVQLGNDTAGGLVPVHQLADVTARRWIIAAINAAVGLAWAADQPTVLQPRFNEASCETDDAALQMQACLLHVATVFKEMDKISGAAKADACRARDQDVSAPPAGCRIGTWSAVVDFVENIKHAREFLEKYKCLAVQRQQLS